MSSTSSSSMPAPFYFSLGARVIIVGNSGSGKSQLLLKIINAYESGLFEIEPTGIAWYSPSINSVPKEILAMKNANHDVDDGGETMKLKVIIFSRLPKIEDLSDYEKKYNIRNAIICIDDMQEESCASSEIAHIFKTIRHSPHYLFFLIQVLFSKQKFSRDLSLNTNYFFLLKVTRGIDSIAHLSRQISLFGDKNAIIGIYKQFLTSCFSYVVLLLDSRIEFDHLRIQTNIFERNYATIFLPSSIVDSISSSDDDKNLNSDFYNLPELVGVLASGSGNNNNDNDT